MNFYRNTYLCNTRYTYTPDKAKYLLHPFGNFLRMVLSP